MTIAADPPLWLQNEQYAARLDRQLIWATMPEGIVRGLGVTPHSPAPDYTVTVAEGMAVIYGDDEDEQGGYLALLGDTVSLPIAAPAGQYRSDRVILRVNDAQAGGPIGDNTTVEVLTGTPTGTANPAAPAVPPTAIELARVMLTPTTTAIAAAQIDGADRFYSRGVGVVEPFAGVSPPSGRLLCDGAAHSRATYADLFSVISTRWGAGNGTTTFNVPDLRGRGLMGYNSADTMFNAVGKYGGTKNSVVVAHTHPINHNHGLIYTSYYDIGNVATTAAGAHSHNYSRMVESSSKASGNQNAGTSLATAQTDTQAAHTHSVNMPQHRHSVDMPNFAGTSGAASSGVSGTNQNLSPYGTVNFVIRV